MCSFNNRETIELPSLACSQPHKPRPIVNCWEGGGAAAGGLANVTVFWSFCFISFAMCNSNKWVDKIEFSQNGSQTTLHSHLPIIYGQNQKAHPSKTSPIFQNRKKTEILICLVFFFYLSILFLNSFFTWQICMALLLKCYGERWWML